MVTFFWGFLAIAATVCIAVFGMIMVRRRVDLAELRMHHEVADPLLSVIGTLFSVLLGFLVAGAMERFDEARLNVQEEAGAVADIFRVAEGLPAQLRTQVQNKCMVYVDTIIGEEWHMMEQKKPSERAWKTYGELWRAVSTYEPATQGQSNLHQALLEAISKLGNYRILRFAAMSNQLPPGMWVVVLAGAVATIAFTYFFGIKNLRVQMLMTSLVATILSLNVFLLANYDYPFSGDIHVSPAAFELDRELFLTLQQKQGQEQKQSSPDQKQ